MFNIRVYGMLVNEKKEILVSDELIKGHRFTKFCGGGLEHGEGTIDCLKREFLEEMNLQIEVTDHLYTTDFFQQSAFNKEHQIISIYYLVKAKESIKIKLTNIPFQFDTEQMNVYATTQQIESFRFIEWEKFSEESVTLPIDKVAAKKLKDFFATIN
jgi:ADP-ribose pyrophosphatase YjhB (NUDIX family)